MAMKGLLGEDPNPQQQNIRPPSGGGQAPAPTNPYGGMQLPQVTPYAATLGASGPDDLEMKRRMMLLMMQQGRR
jgi:hypothetical protein